MSVRLREGLAGLPEYKAGRPATPGPDGRAYKLSSNETPYPPLPGVLEVAQDACHRMHLYPDAANVDITAAVARALGREAPVSEKNLVFGTGSVAVLYLALLAVCSPGDEVVLPWRSFEAYPIGVQLTGARPVPVPLLPDARHDLAGMLDAVTERTRAVLLCSPNNPTGPTLRRAEVVDFINQLPEGVLVVLDEAYVEFVSDPQAVRGLDMMQQFDNVLVLRTFSKAYGLAGFRVGFGVAEPTLAAALRAMSMPFGVSVPAQAAAVASLEARDELLQRVAHVVANRELLAVGLRDLGLEVPDSQGNFVWLPARERTTEWGDWFANQGVMARAYAAGDANDGVRITIGTEDANARVLEIAATLPR